MTTSDSNDTDPLRAAVDSFRAAVETGDLEGIGNAGKKLRGALERGIGVVNPTADSDLEAVADVVPDLVEAFARWAARLADQNSRQRAAQQRLRSTIMQALSLLDPDSPGDSDKARRVLDKAVHDYDKALTAPSLDPTLARLFWEAWRILDQAITCVEDDISDETLKGFQTAVCRALHSAPLVDLAGASSQQAG